MVRPSGDSAGALSVPGFEVSRRTAPPRVSTAQMSPVFSVFSSSSSRSLPVKKMTRPSSDQTGAPALNDSRVSCRRVPPPASTSMIWRLCCVR